MMEVPTPPIGKTSTCLTLLSPTLIWRRSVAWTNSGWRWPDNGWNRVEPCWPAASSTTTVGGSQSTV